MATNPTLGILTAADTESVNNTNTAVPFLIPPGVKRLGFLTNAASCFVTAQRSVGTLASPSSLVATNGNFPLTANVLFWFDVVAQAPSGVNDARNVAAFYNGSGGSASVAVFAEYA